MDLTVILPMSVLLGLQLIMSLLLLAPRAISRPVAALLQLTRTNSAVSSVLYTVAVAVTAMTISSVIQIQGVNKSLNEPVGLTGDRAMVLTVEELRALLSIVLGVSNLALLFLNRSLANEQQISDKAELNLTVLQKQAKGLTKEYMRATQAADSPASGDSGNGESDERRKLQDALEAAQAAAKTATANEAAVKEQAKGLNREYDRLLAENDELKRRLARFDGQFASGDKKST